MKNLNICISAALADAASIYVSTDDCRYYLNGIYVHPHPEQGAVIVATDGHRLVVVHDLAGECRHAKIVRFDKPAKRALSSCKDGQRLSVDDKGILSIPGLYQGVENAVIDATYPDYRRVVSQVVDCIKDKKAGTAAFNAAYIADLEKIGRRLIGLRGQSVVIRSFDATTQALTLWPEVPHAFGVIMPMRARDASGIPAFFKPIMDEAKPRVRRKAGRA